MDSPRDGIDTAFVVLGGPTDPYWPITLQRVTKMEDSSGCGRSVSSYLEIGPCVMIAQRQNDLYRTAATLACKQNNPHRHGLFGDLSVSSLPRVPKSQVIWKFSNETAFLLLSSNRSSGVSNEQLRQ